MSFCCRNSKTPLRENRCSASGLTKAACRAGENLRLARRRRKLTASQVAERAVRTWRSVANSAGITAGEQERRPLILRGARQVGKTFPLPYGLKQGFGDNPTPSREPKIDCWLSGYSPFLDGAVNITRIPVSPGPSRDPGTTDPQPAGLGPMQSPS